MKFLNQFNTKSVFDYLEENKKRKQDSQVLSKTFTVKDINQIAKTDPEIQKITSKPEWKEFVKKHQNSFTIQDIINFDKQDVEDSSDSLKPVMQWKLGRDFKRGLSKWTGMQRNPEFKGKTNYVMQINMTPKTEEMFLDKFSESQAEALKEYKNDNSHPTSKKNLTLSWVRFTILPEHGDNGGVVIDEIQTDLFNTKKVLKDQEMAAFIKDWDKLTMRTFIDYARSKLGYRKIYMPTMETKKSVYSATPPRSLYTDLPRKFNFKKESDMDGYMMLENENAY